MRRSLATAANVNKPPVLPVLQTLTEDPSHQGPLPRPQAGCQLLVTIQPQPCEKQPGRPTGQGALTWQLLWVCSFSGAESLRPGQPHAHLQTAILLTDPHKGALVTQLRAALCEGLVIIWPWAAPAIAATFGGPASLSSRKPEAQCLGPALTEGAPPHGPPPLGPGLRRSRCLRGSKWRNSISASEQTCQVARLGVNSGWL